MSDPMATFNGDAMDRVVTTKDRSVANNLLEPDFWRQVELGSLLEDLARVPLTQNAPRFNENPPPPRPVADGPKDSGGGRTI